MKKIYKRLFDVSYYKSICEQSATQAGVQSICSCVRTFNNEDDGNRRYLFVIIKPHANDTAHTNYHAVMLIYQVSLHVIVQILNHYFHSQQIGVGINTHVSTKSSLEFVILLVIQIQDYLCKNSDIYIQSTHSIYLHKQLQVQLIIYNHDN